MENSSSLGLVLLGLVEMEEQRYLFFLLTFMIYILIMTLNGIMVMVVLREPSLHQPMYILIASLFLNEICGSFSFFPKLMVDLIISSKTISHRNCLIQAACVTNFAFIEMVTFTIMAYDRYFAICHPLRYVTLMTNDKVLKIIVLSWISTILIVSTAILLGWDLPLCEYKINNIFCDNMSYLVLSCVDTSFNRLHTALVVYFYVSITILVTAFSYLRIFMVTLKVSKESRQKAIHTVVTHLLNLSIFLVGLLFIFLRYRLERINISVTVHVFLSSTTLVFPPICNPLIYGIRTHALKVKVIQYFGKINQKSKWSTFRSPSIFISTDM